MLPENMPYYRGLRIQPPADAAAVEALHVQTLLTATVTPVSVSPNTLCIMPIRFGSSSNAAVYQVATSWAMCNSEFASLHSELHNFHGLCITSPPGTWHFSRPSTFLYRKREVPLWILYQPSIWLAVCNKSALSASAFQGSRFTSSRSLQTHESHLIKP
jgi:hypothetical protein